MLNKTPNVSGPYADDVFRWGSARPWKKGSRLNHRTEFRPNEVKTDGKGNVISMPLLVGKPCFGRPEVVFRQKTCRSIISPYGKPVPQLLQCGRCQVRQACLELSVERIEADTNIKSALVAWRDDTMKRHGKLVYTGDSGRYWTEFLKALVRHGPFANSNDDALENHLLREDQRKREKWRKAKRCQRARAHGAHGKLPSYYVRAAIEERQHREDLLRAGRTKCGSPRIAKLPDRSCSIMADAWLGELLLTQSERKCTPGKLARWMVRNGRDHGLKESTLKERLYRDLERIKELEHPINAEAIWPEFDPESYLFIDDDEEPDDVDDRLIDVHDLREFGRSSQPQTPARRAADIAAVLYGIS